MDSVIERINKKCENAKKKLILVSFPKRKIKGNDPYIKPAKGIKGDINWMNTI